MTDIEKTSSMRIVLIGNGIEIEFQENMRKEKIIENALKGKVEYEGEPYESEFPLAIEEFAKRKKLTMFDEKDLGILKSNLNNEMQNKSIEEIYMELEESNSDPKWRKNLKDFFLAYIEHYSDAIDTKNFEKTKKILTNKREIKETKINIIKEKLDTYDLILTTNYTKFLERNLEEKSNKIVYLHGKIGDNKNPPLLGTDKLRSNKILDKIEQTFKKGLRGLDFDSLDTTNIVLDIYGWSLENEYDLIYMVICETIKYLLCQNKGCYGAWNFNHDQMPIIFGKLDIEEWEGIISNNIYTKISIKNIQKMIKRIELNYYCYHQKNLPFNESKDYENFLNYKNVSNNNDQNKWPQKTWLETKKIYLHPCKKRFLESIYLYEPENYQLLPWERDWEDYEKGQIFSNIKNKNISYKEIELNIESSAFSYEKFHLCQAEIDKLKSQE